MPPKKGPRSLGSSRPAECAGPVEGLKIICCQNGNSNLLDFNTAFTPGRGVAGSTTPAAHHRPPPLAGQSYVADLAHVGAILGHLGAILGHLGPILAPTWAHHGANLGPSWAIWGRSWPVLAASCGHLATSHAHVRKCIEKCTKMYKNL